MSELRSVGNSAGSGGVSELRSVGCPLIGYVPGLWSRSVMVTLTPTNDEEEEVDAAVTAKKGLRGP